MTLRIDDKSRHLYLNVGNATISYTDLRLRKEEIESDGISNMNLEVESVEGGEIDEGIVPELDLNRLHKHNDVTSSIGSRTSGGESVISYLNKITLELQDKLNTVRADYQVNLSNSSIKTSSRRSGARISRIVSNNHTEDSTRNARPPRENRMLYHENDISGCVHAKSTTFEDSKLLSEDETGSAIEFQGYKEARDFNTHSTLNRNKYIISTNDTSHECDKYGSIMAINVNKSSNSTEQDEIPIIGTMSNMPSGFYNKHTNSLKGLENSDIDINHENAKPTINLNDEECDEDNAIEEDLNEHKYRNSVSKYKHLTLQELRSLELKNVNENKSDCYECNVLFGSSKGARSNSVNEEVSNNVDLQSAQDTSDITNKGNTGIETCEELFANTMDSKIEVKNISECSLDHLIKLSKVSEKYALLHDKIVSFGGENYGNFTTVGYNLSHTENTNKCIPKPWFEYPLVEKLKPIKNDVYNVFNDSRESKILPLEIDKYTKEIEKYIHEQATYRLDIEDHDRHNVMDPFLEYERVKDENKDLQDTEWAKYGRPISKQCRIAKHGR
ncbi:hypothetical protein BEWA_043480 [Theileria equi strain WA]|uniref:Uncharacterized protein n=1 Tax=Theileria equi strain WA TaxID=1537102 RepID=L1LFW3_THEEQ|nr:hypothetical protein BEWA_043480 [Theileria equi strain WA]EKX74307.1 hypothetical protein BEWA_043480 [Theileria equi strain WA]|eukprot:XP_004833759.1 hypothetical protein BEWA_043480 [Theileria equi strain WA]